ncbi:MAG: hypothetical protein IH946_05985 [Bacteroidetes bacterium]|nr:hypothetical protein [Bacteroidota bacterium]
METKKSKEKDPRQVNFTNNDDGDRDVTNSEEYKESILKELDEEFEELNIEQELRFDVDELDESYEDDYDDI